MLLRLQPTEPPTTKEATNSERTKAFMWAEQ
jgi:hypothetical protein